MISNELFAEDTGLLIIDFQTRLCRVMPDAVVAKSTNNVGHFLCLAKHLELPVIVTEQYPKGLGPTAEGITIAEDLTRYAKTVFSAWRDPHAKAAITATRRRQWIVVGIETHICVYQTVRDLVAQGMTVHVPQDAVVSRRKANWLQGLALCADAGATITVTETALFDLLKEGSGEAFKAISHRIR